MRRRSTLLFALSLFSLLACSGNSGDAGLDGNDGTPGLGGDNGHDGTDGKHGRDSLVRLDSEPAGANCEYGGTAIKSGIDANGDGVLDDDEVTQTSYVCSGGKGEDGALIRLDDEPAGLNCPHGGTAVKSGVDANGNGVLDDAEVEGTQYVCNGGVVGDVTITSPEGVEALAGVRHIVGVLTIEGALSGEVVLSDIEIVEGEIRVVGAAISGLTMPKLKRAGGIVVRAAQLEAVELPQLGEVGTGGLQIGGSNYGNPSLKSFTTPALKTVVGAVELSWNIALKTLDLSSFENAQGYVSIQGTLQLQTISLPALKSVKDGMSLYENKALESFSAPVFASGPIHISSNEKLPSFSLPALTDGGIVVSSNKILESFSVPLLAAGSVQISNNDVLESFMLPVLATATYLSIDGPALKTFSLPILTKIDGYFLIGNSADLESVDLPGLTTIGGSLGLGSYGDSNGCASSSYPNSALTTLNLPALASIGQHLCVANNHVLSSFSLPSLRKVEGTDFRISYNPKLPTCAAENLYNQLDAPRPANKTISGNLGTCP